MPDRSDVYQDEGGEWRWRRIAANNRIIASSGESFASERNAHRSAARVFARDDNRRPWWVPLLVAATFLLGFLLGLALSNDEHDSRPDVPVSTIVTQPPITTTTTSEDPATTSEDPAHPATTLPPRLPRTASAS